MRSKNSARITPAESEHLAKVKSIACACCDGPGGFAHHIEQGQHFATVGLCHACHQGPQGWHGDKTLWRIYRRTMVEALNLTLSRVNELREAE